MKKLPSKLFPNCSYAGTRDVSFTGCIPEGFDHPVSLYLGQETVGSDKAVEKAAAFFDDISVWDKLCRNLFVILGAEGKEGETIVKYFDFYKEEAPTAFGEVDLDTLSLQDMVDRLQLHGMASHDRGREQEFVVDFTLGYDQMLCVKFDWESEILEVAWES